MKHINFKLVILVWLVFYAIRPFLWGIYSDDWLQATFHLDAASALYFNQQPTGSVGSVMLMHLKMYANRPILGVINALIYPFYFYSKSLIAFHLASVFIILLTAFMVYHFVKSLFELLNQPKSEFYGSFAAMLWLISPFIVGFTGCFVSTFTLFCSIFFLASSTFLFKNWLKSSTQLFVPGLLMLLSFLTYEAYFFMFFVLILIFYISGIYKKYSRKYQFRFISVFFALQLLVILFNRLSPYLFSGIVNKSFRGNFSLLIANIINVPYSVLFSTKEVWILALISFLFLFILLINNKIKNSLTFHKVKINLILIFWGVGVFIGVFVYTLAGYVVHSIGIEGKTFQAIAICFTVGMVLIFNVLAETETKKIIVVIPFALIIFTYILGFIFRSNEWIQAFKIQKEVLTKWNPKVLENTSKDAIIICDVPFSPQHDVPIFKDDWSMGASFNYGKTILFGDKKNQNPRNFICGKVSETIHPYKQVFIGHVEYQFTGDSLYRIYNKHIWQKMKTNEVFIWSYETNSFTKLKVNEPVSIPTFFQQRVLLTDIFYALPDNFRNYLNKLIFKNSKNPQAPF